MAGGLGADQQKVVANKQSYIKDALARGMSQGQIDSFIGENPNDYHRLKDTDAYKGGGKPTAPTAPPKPDVQIGDPPRTPPSMAALNKVVTPAAAAPPIATVPSMDAMTGGGGGGGTPSVMGTASGVLRPLGRGRLAAQGSMAIAGLGRRVY